MAVTVRELAHRTRDVLREVERDGARSRDFEWATRGGPRTDRRRRAIGSSTRGVRPIRGGRRQGDRHGKHDESCRGRTRARALSSPALSPRAVKDLLRIARRDASVARSIVRGLESLTNSPTPANLDVKALEGRPPWIRLRVGDWRAILRPLDVDELAELSRSRGERVERGTVYVARVVNRRDLERAIAALP